MFFSEAFVCILNLAFLTGLGVVYSSRGYASGCLEVMERIPAERIWYYGMAGYLLMGVVASCFSAS